MTWCVGRLSFCCAILTIAREHICLQAEEEGYYREVQLAEEVSLGKLCAIKCSNKRENEAKSKKPWKSFLRRYFKGRRTEMPFNIMETPAKLFS